MYADHFALSAMPFENVPDPAFYFNEGDYQRVLSRLSGAMAGGRGLMVVVGPIGSGKTTLSQRLMFSLPESTLKLWCAEPPPSDRVLFQLICEQLGIDRGWESRVQMLSVLRERLLALNTAGQGCLLVVDESHKFTPEGLEAIRLLNNLEDGPSKLIQILLLGQEEFAETLNSPECEPFRQRIANLEVLGRMTAGQVSGYVRHRLRVAGTTEEIFAEPLLEAIAAAGRGIPRVTNTLCDRALMYAFENGHPAVDQQDLLRAGEDTGVYRQIFHRLTTARADKSGERPPDDNPPGETPALPTRPAVLAGEASPPAATSAVRSFGRKTLTGPLVLLAGGMLALGASFAIYCQRAAAAFGDDCLVVLLRNLFN